MDVRNRALVAVLVGTGLSVSEALLVRVGDIDLGAGQVRVGGRRARELRLAGAALVHVEAWLHERASRVTGGKAFLFCTRAGGALEPSYVRRLIARLGREASIGAAVNARLLRETFVAERGRRGVRPEELAQELGHVNLAWTRRRLREARAPGPEVAGSPVETVLAKLLEHAPCGLAVALAERDATGAIVDFSFEYLNPLGAALFGHSADDLVGQSVAERFPDMWDGSVMSLWVSAVESGSLNESRERRVDAIGGMRTFSVRRIPVGERLLLAYIETTEGRQAALAWRAAEVRWQALLDASADGVLELDRAGRVVAASPSAERILGVPSGGLVGSPLPADEQPTRIARPTGSAVRGREVEIRRGDGGLARVMMSSEPLEGAGEPPFPLLVVLSDLGPVLEARADAEAARQALGLAVDGLGVVAVLRARSGAVRSVHGAADELLGVSGGALAGRAGYPGLSRADAARLAAGRGQALRDRVPRTLTVRLAGAPVEVRVVGTGRGPDGEPTGCLEVLRRADSDRA